MSGISGDAEWRASLAAERAWRDALYRGDESPLSPELREKFAGLRWYEPDSRFRFRDVHLARHATPRPSGLAATGEDAVAFLDVGTLVIPFAEGESTLRVFEPAPGEVEETYLFLPFKDATAPTETYGAGRYLDFEPRADDAYEIDFNRAYHPYCAFDDRWACALPPRENRVPVRVTAGERL